MVRRNRPTPGSYAAAPATQPTRTFQEGNLQLTGWTPAKGRHCDRPQQTCGCTAGDKSRILRLQDKQPSQPRSDWIGHDVPASPHARQGARSAGTLQSISPDAQPCGLRQMEGRDSELLNQPAHEVTAPRLIAYIDQGGGQRAVGGRDDAGVAHGDTVQASPTPGCIQQAGGGQAPLGNPVGSRPSMPPCHLIPHSTRREPRGRMTKPGEGRWGRRPRRRPRHADAGCCTAGSGWPR